MIHRSPHSIPASELSAEGATRPAIIKITSVAPEGPVPAPSSTAKPTAPIHLPDPPSAAAKSAEIHLGRPGKRGRHPERRPAYPLVAAAAPRPHGVHAVQLSNYRLRVGGEVPPELAVLLGWGQQRKKGWLRGRQQYSRRRVRPHETRVDRIHALLQDLHTVNLNAARLVVAQVHIDRFHVIMVANRLLDGGALFHGRGRRWRQFQLHCHVQGDGGRHSVVLILSAVILSLINILQGIIMKTHENLYKNS